MVSHLGPFIQSHSTWRLCHKLDYNQLSWLSHRPCLAVLRALIHHITHLLAATSYMLDFTNRLNTDLTRVSSIETEHQHLNPTFAFQRNTRHESC